jgi:hypothetical protein
MADVRLDIAGGPAASLSTTAAVAVVLVATTGFGAFRWPKNGFAERAQHALQHQVAILRARANPDSSQRCR